MSDDANSPDQPADQPDASSAPENADTPDAPDGAETPAGGPTEDAAAGEPSSSPEPPASAFDPDPAESQPAESAPPTESVKVDDLDLDDALRAPVDTDFPTTISKAGLTGALVPIGAGLLGAAVAISAYTSRQGDGNLHWKTYGVGLAATAALLALAVFSAGSVGRKIGGAARGDLVTWPGVVGILAVIPMLEVGLKNSGMSHTAMGYLDGGVITALAVFGYLLARRPAFVVTAILGLGVLWSEVFHDTLAKAFSSDQHVITFAIGVSIFVAAITILGWFLPSRIITGVTVGVVGVVGVGGALASLLLMRLIAGVFGGLMSGFPGSSSTSGSTGSTSQSPLSMGALGHASQNPADYTGKVAVLLALAAGLTLLWALAAIVSDHSGFKLLAIAMPVVAVPLATAVIVVQHPARWEAGLAVGGAVLIALALPMVRGKARKLTSD